MSDHTGKKVQSRNVVKYWRPRRGSVAIALALTFSVAVGLGVYFRKPQIYATPIGGQLAVRTRDGSTITLNTDTEIRVRFSRTARLIDLIRGEAIFETARDPQRPFIVFAGHRHIVAIETRFSVWSTIEGLHVVVLAGQIRLEPTPADKDTQTLIAGTVAEMRANTITLRHPPPQALEDSLAWRTGHIVLQATSLAEAITQFNRYTTRHIDIADSSLQSVVIGGRFRTDNIPGFLHLIGEMGIHSEVQGDHVILSRQR